MASRIDRDVGRIQKILKEKDEYENTIFIFTADNGTALVGGCDRHFFDATKELHGYKSSIYRGGLTVPFIVSWPRKIKAGQVCKTPILLVDFYPTFCQIAKIKPARRIDGVGLAELFTQGKNPKRNCFYWEFGKSQTLRQGHYRWVRHFPKGKTELYNLSINPEENWDISQQYPDLVKHGERKWIRNIRPIQLFPFIPMKNRL